MIKIAKFGHFEQALTFATFNEAREVAARVSIIARVFEESATRFFVQVPRAEGPAWLTAWEDTFVLGDLVRVRGQSITGRIVWVTESTVVIRDESLAGDEDGDELEFRHADVEVLS